MSIAGFLQEKGIIIEVWRPSIVTNASNVTYTPQGELVGTIQDKVDAYSHTLGAFGGYLNASIGLLDTKEEIEDWFMHGVGRHIEVFNSEGDQIFEGFVNSLSGGFGPLSFEKGPLIDVANRVSVIYQLINRTVNPPIDGMQAVTASADDNTSKLAWGVWEKIFNGPGMSATEAIQVRDKFLNDRKEPESSRNLSGGAAEPHVTLSIFGYMHFLKAGIYNQTTNSGTITLATKLAAILDDGGADPNGLFASTNASIEANAILVQRYENDNTVPLALIKGLVAQGEPTNDERTLFGVFQDRKVVYETMPSDVEYTRALSDKLQRVTTEGGVWVYPWDVKAGKWLEITDFLIGEEDQDDLRLDPRMMFLEQVSYTAPWGLDLQGGKVSTLAQRLAQLGTGGVSA